jgi:hypothetical protein
VLHTAEGMALPRQSPRVHATYHAREVRGLCIRAPVGPAQPQGVAVRVGGHQDLPRTSVRVECAPGWARDGASPAAPTVAGPAGRAPRSRRIAGESSGPASSVRAIGTPAAPRGSCAGGRMTGRPAGRPGRGPTGSALSTVAGGGPGQAGTRRRWTELADGSTSPPACRGSALARRHTDRNGLFTVEGAIAGWMLAGASVPGQRCTNAAGGPILCHRRQ